MSIIIRIIVFLSVLIFSDRSLFAQEDVSYKMTVIKELPHTPVKNQSSTQTCWSFSGVSFLESEMLRMGKPEADLSEMFIVNHCYRDKAAKFVRMMGNTNFGPGGIFYDVLYVINKYGLMPEEVYHGIKYNKDLHDHIQMDSVLRKEVEKVIKDKTAAINPSWSDSLGKKVDSYLGSMPENFIYKGKSYTPKNFATDYCGINPDDYVQITSFSHHPFYQPFILEVPDNWLWSNFYNVPLDEMEQIIDNSIRSGYTVAWAADVTESSFKKILASVPETKAASASPPAEHNVLTTHEKTITQEMRQLAFDDHETTDDHGMHIIGLVHDQDGNIYYLVKNSWGNYNTLSGLFYASVSYIRYKTTSIMVNKDAIPKIIRKKLQL